MRGSRQTKWLDRGARLLVEIVVAALAAAVPLITQGAEAVGAEEPLPAFAEVAGARAVHVEAVVTRDGTRLPGLGAEDFRLLVDGEEVAIESFAEISDGRTARGRRVLVFVDDYFALTSDRNQVLHDLRYELEVLAPEDRMAIVAFDGRQVEQLSPWTTSHSTLADALERACERSAYGLRRRSDLRWAGEKRAGGRRSGSLRLDPSNSFSSTGFLGSGRGRLDPDAALDPRQQIAEQVERVAWAAAWALRAFAEPGGRKVLLLVSGGWPAVAPRGAEDAERFAPVRPLIETANRLGYTLYPVALGPSRRDGSGEAGEPLDALHELARATGGRAFAGRTVKSAFRDMIEDTRSYYSLGFAPLWRGDDRVHRLEVQVLRAAGSRVRSRTRFTDLSRSREVDFLLAGAVLSADEAPGAALDVTAGRQLRDGRRRLVVRLDVRIPVAELTLRPPGAGVGGAVELRVSARDENGTALEIPVRTREIGRPASRERGAGAERWQVEVTLSGSRPPQLLVALYEPATGSLWSRKLRLRP